MGHRGPKKQKGKRELNGQLSRRPAERNTRHLDGLDQEQRAMISTAIEARQRVWGLSPAVSRDQMAGSAIGRYCLQGNITRQQYDAAMIYLEVRNDHLIAVRAPRQPGAVDLNATHGSSGDYENINRTHKAIAAYDEMTGVIREKQIEVGNMGNLFGALDAVICRDVMLEHLLGDVRTALNALVKHYGLDGRRAA